MPLYGYGQVGAKVYITCCLIADAVDGQHKHEREHKHENIYFFSFAEIPNVVYENLGNTLLVIYDKHSSKWKRIALILYFSNHCRTSHLSEVCNANT